MDNFNNPNVNNQNYAQQQQGYMPQQGYAMPNNTAPAVKLKTNRSFLKTLLLSFVTFCIYPLVVYSSISTDINIIASKYDGKKTKHFLLMSLILTPLTLGIYSLVWWHGLSDRIGDELRRRNINYKFSSGDFWLWNVLGCLLFGVGPIVFAVKLFKAMNLLSENYNTYG
ncbi:MAG: DUF4234 domain-containing protein [Clostridia bacterium]|nr:DUF4234 domain-containing protein [Clostridia bacterium]